jgi:CheY-like chemotaxis protein
MDPAQVAQILANFCANAKDAILDVGTLDIATGNAFLDDAWCAGRSDAHPGEYVRLTVSDNGRGMDEETAARIFEPFFTTKEVGAGTGLGLATVYGIVSQNGGTVDVTSSPGMGTTFDVYLPRMNEPAAAPKPASIPNTSPGHGETILMVEDEPGLLRSCTATLEKMGYTVIPAETGQEALELFRRHTGTIDLLITDVIMPKMSGKELAERLAELRHGIKVIFVSGYTADVISKKGVLESGVRFLQKPFSAQTLAAAVKAALDGGEHGGEI